MENENNKEKVLVVMDRTFKNERCDDDYNFLESVITECLKKEGYEVDFKYQSTFLSAYDCDLDAEYILKQIDAESAQICFEDYNAVITEGTVSWFWLLAMYPVPLLCINPVVDIYEEYDNLISDELRYILDDILNSRGFQSETSMCVISNENSDNIQYYDNVFTDNTVILSDYSIYSEDFWTDTDSLIKALNYIIENYGDE